MKGGFVKSTTLDFGRPDAALHVVIALLLIPSPLIWDKRVCKKTILD
jgi:hypothetical protein